MSLNHPAGPCYMVEQDYPELPEIRQLSRGTSRARKRHQCGRCQVSIEPGQDYHREAYLFDGDFRYEKWHISGECVLPDGFDPLF